MDAEKETVFSGTLRQLHVSSHSGRDSMHKTFEIKPAQSPSPSQAAIGD